MIERILPAGPHHRARVRCSERVDGDFRVDAPAEELAARRRHLAPGPWTWLRQVHGADLIDVERAGEGAGLEADGSVTSVTGAVLAVQTADCAPVVLIGDGAIAAVHAGWRGIVAGIIPGAIERLIGSGRGPLRAVLGPCIEASAYEFGSDDLETVVAAAGEQARSVTSTGAPALDLAAAVEAQCRAGGVISFERVPEPGPGGSPRDDDPAPRWYSHRRFGDRGRQVTVAWLEPT